MTLHRLRRLARVPLLALPLALGTVTAQPPPAAAQQSDGADEAEVQFRLGNDAYRRADFRVALAHYFASNRLAPNRNVQFNIARCYEQLRQYVEAYRYYEAFAAPEMSPDERRALDDALARVRPYVALLSITSDPPGATIYIGRRDLGGHGVTPRVLALSPGRHDVLLDRAGHDPFQATGVEVKIGDTATLTAPLARILGRLEVVGEPAGAQVTVDDAEGRVTSIMGQTLSLSPGEHRVVVSHPGYVPVEVPAVVQPNGDARVEVRLMRQTGTLVIQSEEPGALVLVDDKPMGFTPSVLNDVPSGRHLVSVQSQGFRTFTTEVDLDPDQRVLVEANMAVAEDVAAASRQTESILDAPASVTLIGEREMEAFAYTDVADALQGVRGTYLSDDMTYVSPGVRGFSPFGQYGNRVLVQLDGHTINDNWIGSSFIGYDLLSSLHPLERIELVRGPGSTLYGTGAFFGVVNLVTPSRAPDHKVELGASMVDLGAFRSYATVGSPLGKDGGFWAYGGGVYSQPKDFVSPSRQASDAGAGVAQAADTWDSASALGKVWLGDVTLQWYFHDRDKQIPTGAFETVFGGPDLATSNDQRAFVEARYEPRLGPSAQLLGRVYLDHYTYDGRLPYGEVGALDEDLSESFNGNWLGAELRSIFRPWDSARFTVGADYQLHFRHEGRGVDTRSGETYYDESHPFQVFSAYAVGDVGLTDWLSVSAGLRFDGWVIQDLALQGAADPSAREDRFLSSLNPRLGLLFHPSKDGTLKVLAGRAFRAPSLYELTYSDGGATQIQSPDLDPETILTGEVEYTHRLPGSFWATGAVFANRISSLIEQTGQATSDDPLRYRNLGEDVFTGGAEVELRREFRRGWMMAAQYSFQRTRKGGLFEGEAVENSPEHLAGVKLVVPLVARELQLATRLAVQSGRLDRDLTRATATEPAVLWDFTLSGEVQALSMHYAAGLRNLLGWRYAHPVGGDVADRALDQRGITGVVDLRFSL